MKSESHSHNDIILHIAERFCSQTLAEDDPQGMCFTVCFPLSLYLELYGATTMLGSCYFDRKTPHYFLSTEAGMILDPTIRQFDASKPAVYMGEKPPVFGDDKEVVLTAIWNDWLYPLYHYGNPKPYPPEITDTRMPFDINRLLKFNFRASVLLKKEMKEKPFHSQSHEQHTSEYISAIHYAYEIYKQAPHTVESLLLEQYESYPE